MTSVAAAHTLMASGLVNTFRQVGTVLGTCVLGTILTSRTAADLPASLAGHGVHGADTHAGTESMALTPTAVPINSMMEVQAPRRDLFHLPHVTAVVTPVIPCLGNEFASIGPDHKRVGTVGVEGVRFDTREGTPTSSKIT